MAAEWSRVEGSTKAPPYSVFNKQIAKSPQDDRDYRLMRLENGLEAMLIHDSKADKAAASLDVAVGHLYDPDDMPGLAHFCEHLLFMGTEQFPRENEYSEYLAKNNGGSNAYTSTSNTNYFFSVATPALEGALDRFSGFFHSPLFSPSCTSRELNAVDSEHKKNFQADMWRIFQLNKHLSKDGHPWRKFGSGNRDSLSQAGKTALKIKSLAPTPIPSRVASPAPSIASNASESEADGGAVGRETRRRLVEWWTKEYCASRMRLCLIGKESLDDLSEMTSRLFSPIQHRGRDPVPMLNSHPFGPNEKSTLISVQTIMEFHAIEISFPLPYQAPHWLYKPGSFLSHFAGHEGPGSLHSYLKAKGWITALNSGPQSLGRGFAMFKATCYLTEAGFLNYREVLLAVFKYFSLLRSSEFPAWIQQELSILSKTRFRFAEKRKPEDYAVWVSEHMIWPVPKELIISAPQIVEEWDSDIGEKEVREALAGMNILEGRAVLMARPDEHNKLPIEGEWLQEPIYKTEYRVMKLDEEFIKEAQKDHDIPELFLPGPNEFVPTNLDVEREQVAEIQPRPHLIRSSPLSDLWYKKDDQFWVPKAHVFIQIDSAHANDSARNSVLTKLYADLVNDSLTQFAYDADLAGLVYQFSTNPNGLWVSMSGYNDKMSVLARDVVEMAKTITIKVDRLDVMKEQLKRDWQNFFLGQTYRLSDFWGRYLLSAQHWTIEECLAELPSVTAEEVQNHFNLILSKTHMTALIAGNIYKEAAVEMVEMVEKILGSEPAPTLHERALLLPAGANYFWEHSVPNPNEPNSSISYYVHGGQTTDQKTRVTLSLLCQILTEPAFNVLRTKEQLGYIVATSQWQLPGQGDVGLRILVQSERGPIYLEGRVDAFLRSMEDVIKNMSDEEFAEQKLGLERRWREQPKNLNEEAMRYWGMVDSGFFDFLRRQHDADYLTNILKSDVLLCFMTKVHPSSTTRAKLSVHLRSQKPQSPKISPAAATAWLALADRIKPGLGRTAWREAMGLGDDEAPSVVEFGKYWIGVLREQDISDEVAKDLLMEVKGLISQHPALGQEEGHLDENVTEIKDVKTFKGVLTLSDAPKPLVEWGDLPLSKY